MTRVPTYNSYMNMVSQTTALKSQLDLYSYQMTTGIRYQQYSGYGMQANSIVNLESMLGVTSNYMENNKIVSIENSSISTALTSIQDTLTDFKSLLVSASGMDLDKTSTDVTGGQIVFGNDDPTAYLNQTITVNGVQYTFSNNNTGNNIDISGAANASDVLQALENKLPANSEFTFEDNTFTYPLYTIDGVSSVLDVDGVTTGDIYSISADQYNTLQSLQTNAFTSLKMLVDALNLNVNGKYLFGGGASTNAPINFPFSSLEEFQAYYDGENILFPDNPAALMSNREFDADDTGALTFASTGGNTGTITAANAGAFLTPAVNANAQNTGTLTFDSNKNTINATQYGAFNTISAGDTLVLNGDGAGANAKVYVVKSVSEDGKTITVEDSTPIEEDLTVNPDNTNPDATVNFSTSLPFDTVLNLEGFSDINLPDHIQITGVSEDGSTLMFTADPGRIPNTTVAVSKDWSLSSSSYYQGGSLSSEKVISDNQSITFDITGGDPVFQKIFEALGKIAQGNLIDTSNPLEGEDLDINTTLNRITDALDLVDSAQYSKGSAANGVLNPDLYTIMAKTDSNAVVLNNVSESQTQLQTNLQNSIYTLKNVNQEEAAIMALMAVNNLNASYACLQEVMSVSLLNYL